MSRQAEIALVAKIELSWNTYYVSDRGGITIDGNAVTNTVISWGDISYKGGQVSNPEKEGGGFDVGGMKIQIAHGEQFQDGGYIFDITDIWNNQIVTVRRWTSGVTTWAGCAAWAKGLIKDFGSDLGQLSFSVERTDEKDDRLLPQIVIENQGDVAVADKQDAVFAVAGNDYAWLETPSKFSAEELLLFQNSTGQREYNRIHHNSGGVFVFENDFSYTYDFNEGDFAEKAFVTVPTSVVGKTIPIQIGSLNDSGIGVMGKGVVVNENIGRQAILFDDHELSSLTDIGVWDEGLERYFTGLASGEYANTDNNCGVLFRVDTTTTLSLPITDSSSDISKITVGDYEKISWVDEDDVGDLHELISTNIIAIGRELMLLLQQPSSGELWVHRGYGGTTKSTHAVNDVVYQTAKYASKNQLSFSEIFSPTSIANHYLYDPADGFAHELNPQYTFGGVESSWDHIIDEDLDTYLRMSHKAASRPNGYHYGITKVNYDAIFKYVTTSARVTKTLIGIKFFWNTTGGTANAYAKAQISVVSPTNTTAGHRVGTVSGGGGGSYGEMTYVLNITSRSSGTFDGISTWYDTIQKISGDDNHMVRYKPDPSIEDNPTGADYHTGYFQTRELQNLNRRWKFQLLSDCIELTSGTDTLFQLYDLKLKMNFFLSLTAYPIVSNLTGRAITSSVATVCGDDTPTRVGDLCENPVDAIALILTQELVFSSSDFTSGWETARDYYKTAGNFTEGTTPVMATSYGVDDERKEGWKLCEWIASHFNLMLIKNYAGAIDIVNLHEIYYNTPAGSEIPIDDILFSKDSGVRRLALYQTGTDLIYNDVVLKWRRNNSTDEYQRAYEIPDSYTLVMSGESITSARENHYRSGKRTLEIESPFIYAEDDAARKAKWEADDKAEVHFWMEFTLEFDYWTDVAGNSAQYKIGDIIYYRGQSNGVDFTATQDTSGGGKFYVVETKLADSGREILIKAKSLQPVTDFVTTSTSGEFIWDDTGGTSISGDDIKDDTGGTGISGDDIIDDTGG